MPLRNRMTIPQGMLAPSGNVDTAVNPMIQATTRPAGSLLAPSPGFDSVRVGRNRFQGKGPSGGFRPMQYAEDVGGSGATLAVIPGETSQIEASEWLPDQSGSLAPVEGSMIISDRQLNPGIAQRLHAAYSIRPDMGDRNPNRPLSRAWWNRFNPSGMLREEYRESPVASVLMGLGLVYAVYLIAGEAEKQIGGYRPRTVGSAATGIPAAGARGAGDVTGDAVDKIGEATDRSVKAIETATDKAVSAIENTAESAKNTVTGE